MKSKELVGGGTKICSWRKYSATKVGWPTKIALWVEREGLSGNFLQPSLQLCALRTPDVMEPDASDMLSARAISSPCPGKDANSPSVTVPAVLGGVKYSPVRRQTLISCLNRQEGSRRSDTE